MGGAPKVLFVWGRELSCHEGDVNDAPMARLGQHARNESCDGLRHSPHLSLVLCAYFADNVHHAGRSRFENLVRITLLNHLSTMFLQQVIYIPWHCSVSVWLLAPRDRCLTRMSE